MRAVLLDHIHQLHHMPPHRGHKAVRTRKILVKIAIFYSVPDKSQSCTESGAL
jgi:hypothetical protein